MAPLNITNNDQSAYLNDTDNDHVEHVRDNHYNNQELLDNDELQNTFNKH